MLSHSQVYYVIIVTLQVAFVLMVLLNTMKSVYIQMIVLNQVSYYP